MDFKKTMNEEQKMQDKSINDVFESSKLKDKKLEGEPKDEEKNNNDLKEVKCKDLLYRIHARNLLQSNV